MSQRSLVFSVALLICAAGTVLAAGPKTDQAPSHHAIPVRALGDPLITIDAEGATGNNLLLGVTFAVGHYWVTGGDAASGVGWLYAIDPGGALVGTYQQAAGCNGWGGRDLVWDGTYLYYGCDDGLIHQADPATGAPTGVTISSPINPPRALAYDPATDHFWTASWDSNIYEIDRAGAIIHNFSPVGLSTYGFAWDQWSPGGPFLWAYSQDGSDPLLMASQINPATGQLTGVSFLGVGAAGDMAGGADPSVEIPGQINRVCLVTMTQGGTDAIVVYDLDFVIPVELSSFTIE